MIFSIKGPDPPSLKLISIQLGLDTTSNPAPPPPPKKGLETNFGTNCNPNSLLASEFVTPDVTIGLHFEQFITHFAVTLVEL